MYLEECSNDWCPSAFLFHSIALSGTFQLQSRNGHASTATQWAGFAQQPHKCNDNKLFFSVSWQFKLYSWVRKDSIIRNIRWLGMRNKLQCNSEWESPEMISHSPSLTIWLYDSIKCTCWLPNISQCQSKMVLWAAPAVEATARPPRICESLGLKADGSHRCKVTGDLRDVWLFQFLLHLKVLWGRILLNRVHQHLLKT